MRIIELTDEQLEIIASALEMFWSDPHYGPRLTDEERYNTQEIEDKIRSYL